MSASVRNVSVEILSIKTLACENGTRPERK